eukprot:m.430166 g.430166  ORF g.430166 m.430166 type:complete len:58 (-) comp77731_c0_seq1:291-464(-)
MQRIKTGGGAAIFCCSVPEPKSFIHSALHSREEGLDVVGTTNHLPPPHTCTQGGRRS